MKRKIIIWIVIVLVILCIDAAALYVWQRDNIKAITDAGKYTSDEIEKQFEENREAVNEVVEENMDITVRDLTDEEKEKFREGTLTEEELIVILTQQESDEESEQQEEESVSSQKASAKSDDDEQDETGEENQSEKEQYQQYQKSLAELIARIYILRQEYTNTLDDMLEQAKLEYSEKTEDEKTKAKLMKWAAGYITQANELEKKCDKEMDGIVDEMTSLINENNGDGTIIDKVIYSYANEKSLKKSWYLSEMKERGLV